MTEACIVCANRPEDNKVGSIGKPFEGIEMKIGDSDEVLIRGENVMHGLLQQPRSDRRGASKPKAFITPAMSAMRTTTAIST